MVDTRRWQAPDTAPYLWRRDGLACASRPGGQPVSGAGEKAKSNGEQVRKIRRILEELGIEVVAPDEARQLLGLKGRDEVAF